MQAEHNFNICEFPHAIKVLDKKTAEEYPDLFEENVQVGEKNYFFPISYTKDAVNFYNFEVRPNDTWIISFPRSGTTWTQELVWMVANNLDYEGAKVLLDKRFPFLEFTSLIPDEIKEELIRKNANNHDKLDILEVVTNPAWKSLADTPSASPRFIKTHLPFSLLPPTLLSSGAKVIYIARNPKDVMVSYYYHKCATIAKYSDYDFKQFWELYKKNLYTFMPYWSHLKEGWQHRHNPNLLFLFYEELSKDLPAVISRVADFYGKTLTSEEVDSLTNHLNIENFRNNPSVNKAKLNDAGVKINGKKSEHSYIRKGKTRGYPEQLQNDLNEEVDKWIADNLKNSDICFPLTDK